MVNDAPATVGLLKRLGKLLVDLHGPHEHQSLLSAAAQLALLDAHAHTGEEKAVYAGIYAKRRTLLEELGVLTADVPDLEGRLDLLRYRVKEIEGAGLVAGEEEAVRGEQAAVGNAARILELAQEVTMAISEGEPNALGVLGSARRALEELGRLLPGGGGWAGELQASGEALAGLSADIQRAVSHIDADGARLEWLDERLAVYERLKRKYGPTLEDVMGTLVESKERLEALVTRGERKAAVEKELAGVEADLRRAGEVLRAKRVKAAKELAAAIMRELRPLGFQRCHFSVMLTPAAVPGPEGLDEVEFMFSANPGEGERPLRAIASSGEISRVMLGIKVVLAAADKIPLLVFDEIDANVGGETAHAVGRKLAEAGRTRQVVAITHLAPVAVCGGVHFAVRKAVEGGRTRTFAVRLEGGARTEEIARMLGGRDASGIVMKHAEELLAGGVGGGVSDVFRGSGRTG